MPRREGGGFTSISAHFHRALSSLTQFRSNAERVKHDRGPPPFWTDGTCTYADARAHKTHTRTHLISDTNRDGCSVSLVVAALRLGCSTTSVAHGSSTGCQEFKKSKCACFFLTCTLRLEAAGAMSPTMYKRTHKFTPCTPSLSGGNLANEKGRVDNRGAYKRVLGARSNDTARARA